MKRKKRELTELQAGYENKNTGRRRIIFKILIGLLLLICVALGGMFWYRKELKPVKAEDSAPVICYENIVAITFDDGPKRGTTDKLLEGLEERGVKATFFLIGQNIEGNEDLIQRMYDDGNLIGNHTYSHVQLSTIGHEEAMDEITETNNKIWEITGYTPKFIRPPYGSYSEKLTEDINMTPILWSVDPRDWDTNNSAKVVSSVVKNVKSGDIILLHDCYDSSVAAALEIIDELKAKGFVFVTADQLILD